MLDQITDHSRPLPPTAPTNQDRVYEAVAGRDLDAAVIVPPRSTAVPGASAETARTQRDQHIQDITSLGRMGWQKSSGYNLRARSRRRSVDTSA
jgi:hypothetical protein